MTGVKPSKLPYDLAKVVVTLTCFFQGIGPLVVRLLLRREPLGTRLRPHLGLPSPWWWIACIAIVLGGLALHEVIDGAQRRRFPDA